MFELVEARVSPFESFKRCHFLWFMLLSFNRSISTITLEVLLHDSLSLAACFPDIYYRFCYQEAAFVTGGLINMVHHGNKVYYHPLPYIAPFTFHTSTALDFYISTSLTTKNTDLHSWIQIYIHFTQKQLKFNSQTNSKIFIETQMDYFVPVLWANALFSTTKILTCC